MLCQFSEVAVELLKGVAHLDEAVDDIGVLGGNVDGVAMLHGFASTGNSHSLLLDEMMNDAYLLDVLLVVTANTAGILLRCNLRKLFLPKAEGGFCYAKHFRYFANGVVELEVFIFL